MEKRCTEQIKHLLRPHDSIQDYEYLESHYKPSAPHGYEDVLSDYSAMDVKEYDKYSLRRWHSDDGASLTEYDFLDIDDFGNDYDDFRYRFW